MTDALPNLGKKHHQLLNFWTSLGHRISQEIAVLCGDFIAHIIYGSKLPINRMNTVEVRLAREEDAPFIALLGRTTFTETFGHLFRDQQDLIDYYNSTFSVQKIEDGMKKQNNVFWIAFVDRLPVGYAKLKLHSSSEFVESTDVCQLQKIYVLKDFLSMGIGFEMQDALLKKAKELGFTNIWLSVLNSNERAISFYRKTGFENIGNHDFQIGKEHSEFTAMLKTLA